MPDGTDWSVIEMSFTRAKGELDLALRQYKNELGIALLAGLTNPLAFVVMDADLRAYVALVVDVDHVELTIRRQHRAEIVATEIPLVTKGEYEVPNTTPCQRGVDDILERFTNAGF